MAVGGVEASRDQDEVGVELPSDWQNHRPESSEILRVTKLGGWNSETRRRRRRGGGGGDIVTYMHECRFEIPLWSKRTTNNDLDFGQNALL